MASVFRKKNPRTGKPYPVWFFKYRDHAGVWRYGKGWPLKQPTLDHANALEAEHRAVRKGEKEAPPAWSKKRHTPIQEVVAEYLAWGAAQGGRKGKSWSPRHAYGRSLFLKAWIRDLGLSTLADVDLTRVESRTRDMLATRTGKTVAGRVEALKALCTWAVKRGYLPSNPLAAVGRFDLKPTNPHRALTDEEVSRLLAATPPERGLLYRVALATGYRAGELRALRVCDLDMFGPSVCLSGEFTKNREDARQPIARDLASELAESVKGQAPDSPLLHIPRKETTWENFARDVKAAQIVPATTEGKATFHSLRVTYINSVVESGTDLKTIMQLARHGSAFMSMQTYAKPKPERLREAAEAVANRIEQASQGAASCSDVARVAVGAGSEIVSASQDNGLAVVKDGAPTRTRTRSATGEWGEHDQGRKHASAYQIRTLQEIERHQPSANRSSIRHY